MTLKIGDEVKIGEHPDIVPNAVGLVYRITDIHQEYENEHTGDVIQNPNGWPGGIVHHSYDPEYDEVLSGDVVFTPKLSPLKSWRGVKPGDEFIILEVERGLMQMEVGDHVRVVRENHTGFAMQIVGKHDDSAMNDGYVYYPHMVAHYVEVSNNEDALVYLEAEE